MDKKIQNRNRRVQYKTKITYPNQIKFGSRIDIPNKRMGSKAASYNTRVYISNISGGGGTQYVFITWETIYLPQEIREI